jgi:hypothetical protein
MLILRLLVLLGGLALVLGTLRSAIRTFVVPRSINDPLTRLVFMNVRKLFNLRLRRATSYGDRDRVLALYAPVALLCLPLVWLTLVLSGYTSIFWALDMPPLRTAFRDSGSSLLTLGFETVNDLAATVLAFSEASIGLLLVALLIAYLPTMYAAFSRRELAVTLLEVRAGSPPSAVEMLVRFHRLQQLDQLTQLWETWEMWFAELDETHTSLGALAFFRSPQPEHSWVTAAGAVLDAAALVSSTVDVPRNVQGELCLRAGYLALRHIVAFFRIPFQDAPKADDPISIRREEYDEACEQLASAGIPLKPDRDAAWRAFSGWRVNYDDTLLALAALTSAPYAPWSSDRSRLPAGAPMARLVQGDGAPAHR